MRQLSRLCLLALFVAAWCNLSLAGTPVTPAVPELLTLTPQGRVISDSLQVIDSHPVSDLRDLTVTLRQELLLLDLEGQLIHLTLQDSLISRPLGEDVGLTSWPEAVAADGSGYLLLVDQGRGIRRLGRRGEDLGYFALPGEDLFWREMSSDRSGRIWLSAGIRGLTMTLTRSGQLMQSWQLDRLISGYRGPLRAWCPDQRGGLMLLEGRPATFHHLNAAGNLMVSRAVELPDRGDPGLLWDEKRGLVILALPGSGETVLLAGPLTGGEYLVAERSWLHLIKPIGR
jgi:hypothetical protein